MEEALIALLLADSGVIALAQNRIYWSRAPQGQVVRPYAVLRRISGNPVYHMTDPSSLIESRVQIDSYDTTYSGAKGLSRALQAVISGYRGDTGGKHFSGIFIDGERDLEDAQEPGQTANLFCTSFDNIIWHD